jgi:hypothetical protein
MSSMVKLTCLERCSVAGIVYLPGPLEVDAETAALLQRHRPHAFKADGGGIREVSPGDVGDVPNDDAPAPEKRRQKPAKYKRKG